eukprot:1208436-Pyramimonas_sp.AAC.1
MSEHGGIFILTVARLMLLRPGALAPGPNIFLVGVGCASSCVCSLHAPPSCPPPHGTLACGWGAVLFAVPLLCALLWPSAPAPSRRDVVAGARRAWALGRSGPLDLSSCCFLCAVTQVFALVKVPASPSAAGSFP